MTCKLISLMCTTAAALMLCGIVQAQTPAKFDSETISGLGARNIGSATMSGRVATLAANRDSTGKLTIFVGAALALVVTSAIGVIAGSAISQYVSEKTLHYLAGIGFIAIGVWTLVKA